MRPSYLKEGTEAHAIIVCLAANNTHTPLQLDLLERRFGRLLGHMHPQLHHPAHQLHDERHLAPQVRTHTQERLLVQQEAELTAQVPHPEAVAWLQQGARLRHAVQEGEELAVLVAERILRRPAVKRDQYRTLDLVKKMKVYVLRH